MEPRPKPVGVIWHQLPGGPWDRERAARGIVEVLQGLPQLHPDVPTALRVDPIEDPAARPAERRVKQAPAPLSYREVARKLSLLGWDEAVEDWQAEMAAGLAPAPLAIPRRKVARSGRRLASQKEMPRPASPTSRKPRTIHIRPGEGGWHPRLSNFSSATAASVLEETLGRPVNRRIPGGGQLWIWDARNPDTSDLLLADGNTLVHGRMSSDDVQGGETGASHIDPCLELCHQTEELRPRMVILATEVSGTWPLKRRQDIQLARAAMERGWVRHVVWRWGDRIARDVLPAEMYYALLKERRISLWLAMWRRKAHWRSDQLALRAMNMVSAEERNQSTHRMQMAALLQGPVAGRGWLQSIPIGWKRDRDGRTPLWDPEAWKWIRPAFRLSAQMEDASHNSTRQVAERLARDYACPIDHDKLRAMVQDPLYVTGEWTVNLRGMAVSMTPLPMEEPIPAEWFQRIQDLFALRQGRTNRTPLGSFILNYVECAHARCEGAENKRGNPALIKGYYPSDGRSKRTSRSARYRHCPFAPEQCKHKGFTWEREDLERPVIEQLRRLLEHPELLKAWGEATRYQLAETTGRDVSEREEIQCKLELMLARRQEAERKFLDRLTQPGEVDMEEVWTRLVGSVHEEVEALQRQLEDLEQQEALDEPGSPAASQREKRLEAALEILTVEVPEDPRMRILRARVFQQMVSKVLISEDEQGRTWVELFGHLIPTDIPSLAKADPLQAASEQLDAYLEKNSAQNGGGPAEDWLVVRADGSAGAAGEAEAAEEDWLVGDGAGAGAVDRDGDRDRDGSFRTDSEISDFKSVRKHLADVLERPSIKEQEREARKAEVHQGWHKRLALSCPSGIPAWASSRALVIDGCYSHQEVRRRTHRLTPRQAQAVEVYLEGADRQTMAGQLGVSPCSVDRLLKAACARLGVAHPRQLPRANHGLAAERRDAAVITLPADRRRRDQLGQASRRHRGG